MAIYSTYPEIDFDLDVVTEPMPEFGDDQPALGSQLLVGRTVARRKAYTALALLDWDPNEKDPGKQWEHAESVIREAIDRNVVKDWGN